MKRHKIGKRFIEELQKNPNISMVCEKLNVSRQSIYRWMEEDTNFRRRLNDALLLGNESINDLCEMKLVTLAKQGHFPSIKYWLGHHKYNYLPHKPDRFWADMGKKNELALGGMMLINSDGRIDYIKDNERIETNLKEDSEIFRELTQKYGGVIFKVVDPKKDNNQRNDSQGSPS